VQQPEWAQPDWSSGEPAPRRRRGDEYRPVGHGILDEAPTTERPAPAPAAPFPADTNPQLAEILAKSGVTPPSGGRRRRRYRDDDDPADDVLSRVLGRP
jgi:hypothetical protein